MPALTSTSSTYAIGEVAKRAEVSVQTLRHYDKLGLLTPSEVTAAGYRRYSEYDCTRLALIRTLRSVGVELKVIGDLLERRTSVADVLQLQVATLAEQARVLTRQQTLLEAVLASNTSDDGSDDALLERLQHLSVLAKLDALEQQQFLAHQLNWQPTTPQSQQVWDAAVLDLPETLDAAQLEVWLELANIVTNARFQEVLRLQQAPFKTVPADKLAAWHTSLADILESVISHSTLTIGSEPFQDIVTSWLNAFAEVLNQAVDGVFASWVCDYLDTTQDDLIERYWQLTARLKDMPFSDAQARAMDKLANGLKLRLEQASAS
ncbi:MAG: MerR family transcriptional regulator [Deinococcota bacterium]